MEFFTNSFQEFSIFHQIFKKVPKSREYFSLSWRFDRFLIKIQTKWNFSIPFNNSHFSNPFHQTFLQKRSQNLKNKIRSLSPKSIISPLKSKLSGIPHKFFSRILNIPIRFISILLKNVPKESQNLENTDSLSQKSIVSSTKFKLSGILHQFFSRPILPTFPNRSIKHSSKKVLKISK